jgi:hypothetical protein
LFVHRILALAEEFYNLLRADIHPAGLGEERIHTPQADFDQFCGQSQCHVTLLHLIGRGRAREMLKNSGEQSPDPLGRQLLARSWSVIPNLGVKPDLAGWVGSHSHLELRRPGRRSRRDIVEISMAIMARWP